MKSPISIDKLSSKFNPKKVDSS